MADVAADLKTWSTTASSNSPSGSTSVGTNLDDNLREIQKVIRQDLSNIATDVASATTTDIGAVASNYVRITGTVTITGLGTVSSGIWKFVRFAGALTLTHNASSLILPGGASITTAAGDCGIFVSEGSGNWQCLSYTRAATVPGAFVSGTAVVFAQTSAPTGWTKSATHNDKALRVVSGTASSGGSTAFTSVFGAGKSSGSFVLTSAEVPVHAHVLSGNIRVANSGGGALGGLTSGAVDSVTSTGLLGFSIGTTENSGSGGGHAHTLSLDLQYMDVIVATKD
jgi:hypothetical protein